MDWSTFVADMARAVALIAVINLPIAAFMLFFVRRKKVAER
jgi:hypothetical protein